MHHIKYGVEIGLPDINIKQKFESYFNPQSQLEEKRPANTLGLSGNTSKLICWNDYFTGNKFIILCPGQGRVTSGTKIVILFIV